MAEYIYALYHYKGGVDKKIYFYVGRTEREQGVRHREHIAAADKGTTDVYRYIREEVPCQIFEEEVLCWVEDEKPEDYEDFYVIKLLQEGHSLKNMKHGDQKKIAELHSIAESVTLQSVSHLRAYKAQKQREAYERSEKLRAEVLADKPTGKRAEFMQHLQHVASETVVRLAEQKKAQAKERRAARKAAELAALKAKLGPLFDVEDE